jgi:N-methylhydantoinase B
MNVNTVDNRTGRRVVASIDPITGGAGGDPRRDGTDGSGANNAFLKNTPVEINETEVPIKILRYGLVRDSGGAGKHRGGLATELEFEVFAPGTRVTARNRDRTRFTSWGILGGRGGAPSRFLLNPGTEGEVDLGNTDILTVGPGDVIRIASGGAGGWGSPLERPSEQVLLDVRRGFVSADRARDDYSVVLVDGGIDEAATRELREARRSQESNAFYQFGPAREAFEVVWSQARYRRLTGCLEQVPVHWRFFVKHRVFAWVEALGEEAAGHPDPVGTAFEATLAAFPQLRLAMEQAA